MITSLWGNVLYLGISQKGSGCSIKMSTMSLETKKKDAPALKSLTTLCSVGK